MIKILKKNFIKEKQIPCIVWDGKTMSYPHLTQKQINTIHTDTKYKDWIVTLKK